MNSLNDNWITENRIDFEYKKYILLAYLQEVTKKFDVFQLYPTLMDLISHHKNLVTLKRSRENLKKGFKEELQKFDAENLALVFKKAEEDEGIMDEIMRIIDFSIPQFQKYLNEGSSMFDAVSNSMLLRPVGIESLRQEEGYLMLENAGQKSTCVYEYQISIFEHSEAVFRGIHTDFIAQYEHSLTVTLESIKIDIVKTEGKFSNPATYHITSAMTLPLEETLLPIAKRKLLWHVSNKMVA